MQSNRNQRKICISKKVRYCLSLTLRHHYLLGPSGSVRLIDLSHQVNQPVLEQDNEISCIDVNVDNSMMSLVGKVSNIFLYFMRRYLLDYAAIVDH